MKTLMSGLAIYYVGPIRPFGAQEAINPTPNQRAGLLYGERAKQVKHHTPVKQAC